MTLPTLRVVIVAWNAADELPRCLAALAAMRREHFVLEHVIVVDNASLDDSCGVAQRAGAGLGVNVLSNRENVGYARAANQGAAGGSTDYLLFLNPDARVAPGTLDTLVAHMERPEWARVGICGPLLEGEGGEVQRECAAFPTPATFLAKSAGLDVLLSGHVPTLQLEEFDHLTSREVDHVMGSVYLVRGLLFREVGAFDERFFVYLEDLDLSLRARQHGYATRYVAEARAFHRGGKNATTARPARLAYSLESRIRYAFKHFSRGEALAVAAATLGLEPTLRLARGLARGSWSEATTTVRGYRQAIARLARPR